MVEVMITPRSVGPFLLGIASQHFLQFRVVVVADALAVSFLPLSSIRPHGNLRFFDFPTTLKILYFNPYLEVVKKSAL